MPNARPPMEPEPLAPLTRGEADSSGGRVRLARRADPALLPTIEDSGAETFARYGQPLADGSPAKPGHYEGIAGERVDLGERGGRWASHRIPYFGLTEAANV